MGIIRKTFRDNKKYKKYRKILDQELVKRIYAGKLTKEDRKLRKEYLINLALNYYMRSSKYLTNDNKNYSLRCEQDILENHLRSL